MMVVSGTLASEPRSIGEHFLMRAKQLTPNPHDLGSLTRIVTWKELRV